MQFTNSSVQSQLSSIKMLDIHHASVLVGIVSLAEIILCFEMSTTVPSVIVGELQSNS